MICILRTAIILISVFLAYLPSKASTFDVHQFDEGHYELTIWGVIAPGDDEIFKQALLKEIRAGHLLRWVNTFTPGGNVDAALGIGRQIRLLQASTNAPTDTGIRGEGPFCYNGPKGNRNKIAAGKCDCASACFMLWLSGTGREGNHVGVHRFYYDSKYFAGLTAPEARSHYEAGMRETRKFYDEMGGVPDSILKKLYDTSSKSIQYLTYEELDQLRNTPPWLDQLVVDKCPPNVEPDPEGTDDPKQDACIDTVYDQLIVEGSQKFLDRYGSANEKFDIAH